MKTALLRFLHLFMAVVVLLSSMGFGLVEHSCQLRGKRVYSVYDAQPGCRLCKAKATAAKTPAIKRTDCCKDEARYSKVDTASSLSQLLAKFIKTLAAGANTGVAAVFVAIFAGLFSLSASESAGHYESPPPLSGRALLAFVQTYLI